MGDQPATGSIYDFKVKTIDGEEVSMEKYRGFVLLIVNVASSCGFTSTHYKELNELHDKYEEKGLRILGFPSNQFFQESGSESEICSFAKDRGVKFEMFAKVDVNGDKAHPLWNFLKHKKGGTFGNAIKWNFTKFIVSRDGEVVLRAGSMTNPSALTKDLEKYLNNPAAEIPRSEL